MIATVPFSIPPRALALLTLVALGCGQSAAQESQDARFARFDKDGDGKVSREEAKGTLLESRFDALDRNGDGFITPDEVPRRRMAATAAPAGAGGGSSGGAVHLDIPYAEVPPGVDANHLSLDVYAPAEAEGLPVMVYIHGGGWRTGDKRRVHRKAAYFTGRQFVFVSLNYRLVPEVDLYRQLQDSADAVAWVKRNIARHGGDPARLHLIGHSAGGHHVAILATNERFLGEAGLALADLSSAVVLDTQALDLHELMSGGGNALYRQAFGDDPEAWRQVSPRDHVAEGKGIPPFFLVVAGGRGPKLARNAPFQEALEAVGVRCELVKAPQHDHSSVNHSLGDPQDEVTQAMEAFHDSPLGQEIE